MHARFVRAFWMRYRRPAGDIVLRARSSKTHHLSRSRRHRQLRIPLGNTTRTGYPHTAGSGRRICRMWICSLADIITLIFLDQDYFDVYIDDRSAKNANTRGLGVIHVLNRAPFSATISSTSISTFFHSKLTLTPPSAYQLQGVEEARGSVETIASTLAGTTPWSRCA